MEKDLLLKHDKTNNLTYIIELDQKISDSIKDLERTLKNIINSSSEKDSTLQKSLDDSKTKF